MYVGVLLDYPNARVVTVEADYWYTTGEDQSITIERKLPPDDETKYSRTTPVLSLRYWQGVIAHESREGAEAALRTLFPAQDRGKPAVELERAEPETIAL